MSFGTQTAEDVAFCIAIKGAKEEFRGAYKQFNLDREELTMFVNIENTSSIRKGDILYFNESQSTLEEFRGCAIRVEQIEEDDKRHISASVPDRSWIREVGVDSWNKSLDFDGVHAHVENGMHVGRLSWLVDDFELNQELDNFLDEL